MLRIALAQVNATVGDLDGNAELIVEWTRRAAARGARVVVFPEMMLTGYPVEDLALRASFVEASIATLRDVAARLGAEGLGAIAICEDLWQDGGPVAVCRRAGAGLLLVPNASPYERGKDDVRLDLVVRRAREAGAALAYANMTGGQDELVFDGDSLVVDAAGRLIARGPQFEDTLVLADLDLPAAGPARADGDSPVDAGDGTVMTIHRLTLPAPARAPEGGV